MKKLLALLLVAAMVMSMFMTVSFTAYADESVLTQAEKNARDTVAPKDSDGRYKITGWWDKSITYFEDESPTDDTTSDSYIDRLSRSDAVSANGHESWFTHPTYGGTWRFDASGSEYKNEEAWFQMDMGISSKVTTIKYKVDQSGAYNYSTALNNTPRMVKVMWSDDEATWQERVFTFNYDSPDHPMYPYLQAYKTASENGEGYDESSRFDWVSMDFGEETPIKGRYFRVAILIPNLNLATQEDMDDGSSYRFTGSHLYMYDASVPAYEGEGAGTEQNPYLISSKADLKNFADCLNGGNAFAGRYFKMTADIDLAGVDAYTEGYNLGSIHDSWSRPFSGSFDGDGHKITNYSYIENSSGGDFGALFGAVVGSESDRAVVKNLTVTGSVTSPKWTGGIAGYAKYADFINCTSEVALTNVYWEYKGGIVGELINSTITGCTNTGYLYFDGSQHSSGGLVGRAENSVISNSVNKGDISFNNTQGTNPAAGGLVGGTIGTVKLINCGNEGNVSHNNGNWEIGMLFGLANNGTVEIKDCYNLGWGYAGGFFGRAIGGAHVTVDNSYSMSTSYNKIDCISTDGGSAAFTNCYVLSDNASVSEGVSIKSLDDFATLATALNNGRSETVWVDGEEGYPVYFVATEEEVVTTAVINGFTDATVSYTVTLADADKSAVVIIALYSGDELAAVKIVDADLDSHTFDALNGAESAKIFVWENLTTIKPLAIDEYTF